MLSEAQPRLQRATLEVPPQQAGDRRAEEEDAFIEAITGHLRHAIAVNHESNLSRGSILEEESLILVTADHHR